MTSPSEQTTKRRPGRPCKPDSEAKRNFFQTRIREPIRQKLLAAAAENGRSLSEEIEQRLEQSFGDEKLAERLETVEILLRELMAKINNAR